MLNTLQLLTWKYLRLRRPAPWQRGTSVPNLRRFWDEMGARARNHSLEEAE